jgi:UDP-galactose transporter B1
VHKDAPPPLTNGSAKEKTANGTTNGHAHPHERKHHHDKPDTRFSPKALLMRYAQCSLFITSAAPFGFAALSYISYPAMVLGKSCKLVPVMIMNVLLYRRKFARHKYLVVFMVTTGITIFMGFGPKKGGHGKAKSHNNQANNPYANLIGMTYLLINLALDGAINSTQDEIFSRFKVTGQQMMLWINLFCTIISTFLSILPLPYIPVIHESPGGTSELAVALAFVKSHSGIVVPLAQFTLTGALGQLFIFETLQHFGSLTLVYVQALSFLLQIILTLLLVLPRTITLTRKLFTMLLSVIVYKHKLTPGQWLGTAVVFAGISVEAYVKRRGSSNFHGSSSVPPVTTNADKRCPVSLHPRFLSPDDIRYHIPPVPLGLDDLLVDSSLVIRGPREARNPGEGKGQTKITVIILEHWIHRI